MSVFIKKIIYRYYNINNRKKLLLSKLKGFFVIIHFIFIILILLFILYDLMVGLDFIKYHFKILKIFNKISSLVNLYFYKSTLIGLNP